MNNKEKAIGIFDSGLGGLTVVKSVIELMPNENIIYFGDTAHVPYGNRSREQITQYVMNDVRFLNGFDIKAIVIACNTADSIAGKKVEEKYAMPVFGVVEAASKKAAQVTKNGKIGVMATNATVSSGAYENTIKKYNSELAVISEACPLLVPLVEEGRFRKGDIVAQSVTAEYLKVMKSENVDTLILGCTHYPLLEEIIKEQLPDVNIISSSHEAAVRLKLMFEKNNMESSRKEKGSHRYFVSDKAENFEKFAKIFMGSEIDCAVREVDPQ